MAAKEPISTLFVSGNRRAKSHKCNSTCPIMYAWCWRYVQCSAQSIVCAQEWFLYRAYMTWIFLQPVSSGTLHNSHVFHHDETLCAVWLFLIMQSSLHESSLYLRHAVQCTNLKTIASVLLRAPSCCRLHDILQIKRFNLVLRLPWPLKCQGFWDDCSQKWCQRFQV